MNYQNLEKEIKEYSIYFKYCDSINAKFISFFRVFTQSGSKFLSKSKKSMEEFCDEVNKEEYFPSTLNKSINTLCSELKEIMDKFQNVISNIEKDIINKIVEFDKNYKINFKNSINNLTNLSDYLLDNKNKLEKVKYNYFESCKQVEDYDKKYISGKNKENIKDDEYARNKEQFKKLKETSENKKVNYRIEVTKFNDLLLSNENYYAGIINEISKQEEERNQFYTNIFLSLNNYLNQYNSEAKESLIKNLKYINDIFTKRDTKMFSIYFNKTNNNKEHNRFLFEEFFDLENIKTPKTNNEISDGKEELNKNKDINLKKNKKEDENDINDIKKLNYDLCATIFEIGKKPLIDANTMDNEFLELDNIIFNLINRDEKLADEKYVRIISTVEGKCEGCKNIIYLLMGYYCINNLVKFNSIENFFLLNSILNIIINYVWENADYAYLTFFILYIGEKTIYSENNTQYPKNHLCKILSKNPIYHSYDFWNKLIILKIKMLAKIKIKEEYNIRKKNNKKKDSIISKIFRVNNEDNEKMERDILYNQIYKEKSNNYLNEILTEFIGHFINYDFIEKKTFSLIENLSEQYNLNAKQKNYFIKMIESNIIYKKESNPYFNEMTKMEDKEEINKICLKYYPNKKFKKVKNDKIKILLLLIKYLENNDIINILCLNKETYSILKKYFYKDILIKRHSNFDVKKHISIWKILLNYNQIKSKYNYPKIKESLIDKNKTKELIFDTIELDCIRTSFKINQESNRIKLGNILKVSSKQLPSVDYCQGMNHIAAFFLVLCDENEEEAFYLFMCFLLETNYCNLIGNDLSKLNKYFYCFERLINMMLPEMDNYLISNNINGGYFLSPWFITLFTIAFYQEKDENNFEIIMKLLDIFLFSGWKAIFKIGISLIKANSGKIFQLPYEKLINYLNNELTHTDFFKDNNSEEIINIFINFKISNNLLEHLFQEYDLKQNILSKQLN